MYVYVLLVIIILVIIYNNIYEGSDYSIIITSSYIISHPSIDIIKETIESLKYINMKKGTKIILAHDYHYNDDYYKYLDTLNNYIKDNDDIEIIVRSDHGNLTGNIRNSINYINTKYILVIQHDLPFIDYFDINKVIEDLEINKNIKHVRFNKRKNTKDGFDNKVDNDLFGLNIKSKNYTYTRTPGWSDNNHLCLTDYYKNIVLKEVNDGEFMEKILNDKITSKEKHDKYGTYLFGPVNHKQMIKHTDGRNFIQNNN